MQPYTISGPALLKLMRAHKVTLRELKRRMGITLKRIREGLTDASAARDWIEAITGKDPGPQYHERNPTMDPTQIARRGNSKRHDNAIIGQLLRAVGPIGHGACRGCGNSTDLMGLDDHEGRPYLELCYLSPRLSAPWSAT